MAKSETKTIEHEQVENKPEVETRPAGEASGQSVGSQVEQKQVEQSEQHSEATDGIRARRGLTLKQLVPSQDWIMQNIVAGGKGTRATVGRIFGVVTSTQRKTNMVQDQAIESVACIGILNSESYLTGEVSQGSSVYFPMAYAEQLEALFKADPSINVIEVDVDIGLEATGKTIPYEWVTTAFLEGREMAVLKRMRGARKRPEHLLIAPDGAPKQLTAPAK
jgi:hypothetical protein